MVQADAKPDWFAELVQVLDQFRKIHGGLVLPELSSAAAASDQPAISRALRAQIWRLRGYREGVLHGAQVQEPEAVALVDAAELALKNASRLLLALELNWNLENLPPPQFFAAPCPKCKAEVHITGAPEHHTCWKCNARLVTELVEDVQEPKRDEPVAGALKWLFNKTRRAFPKNKKVYLIGISRFEVSQGRRRFVVDYVGDHFFLRIKARSGDAMPLSNGAVGRAFVEQATRQCTSIEQAQRLLFKQLRAGQKKK